VIPGHNKRIVALLPSPEYRRLEQWATREDRVVDQQVTHLVRQALAQLPPTIDLHPEPSAA